MKTVVRQLERGKSDGLLEKTKIDLPRYTCTCNLPTIPGIFIMNVKKD